MIENEINIYKHKHERTNKRSKTEKIDNTIMNLKWINKLRNRAKKIIDEPIFIKRDYTSEEMLENAKIHCQANRPLKTIKEFDGLTKFCQCCYNPMKDNIHVTNFNYCANISEFAEFGLGISFFYFYLKYACVILFFAFCVMALPNLIITKKCTEEIINLYTQMLFKGDYNLKLPFPYSNGIFNINNTETNKFYSQIMILLKFNSMNLKQYQDIYFNITNNDNIKNVMINYHLIYFIGLSTLFIVHSLYTILLFNIKKQYDMLVTSPSDYAVVISNLNSAFRIFYSEINKINELLKVNIKKENLLKNNYIEPENELNSSRNILRRFHEIDLGKLNKDNKINITDAFKEFIKNVVCGNENREQYNIFLINICYKINEYKLLQDTIKEKNNEIYIAKNDPEQILKNMKLNLTKNEIKYFHYPFDLFHLYISPFTLYEKSSNVSEIEKAKQELEEKVKNISKETNNLSDHTFSGVVIVIFNSMKEKDKFLESINKNLIMSILASISNLKYYLCHCCINTAEKRDFFLKHNISIEEAPEPEDIIYENLEFSWVQRLFRVILVYIISFILIALCFFFILYLNKIQIKKSQNDKKTNILNKYSVSISISLCIAIINSIFQTILIILTKMEKQICMTNYFLSYSIKLTILTFLSSTIIPYLSNKYYNEQLNLDLLITNCFTMFLSNSFLIPITWTINFDYFLKKVRKFIIKKKKKCLPQNELNVLYELLDMDIASKYSYVARTLLMSFFYLPIFPLGIIICFIGFIFAYLLEKYNFIKKIIKMIFI